MGRFFFVSPTGNGLGTKHRKHLDSNMFIEELWMWRTQLVSCFNKPVCWSNVERHLCNFTCKVTSGLLCILTNCLLLDWIVSPSWITLSELRSKEGKPLVRNMVYIWKSFTSNDVPSSYPLRVYANPRITVPYSCILGQEPEDVNLVENERTELQKGGQSFPTMTCYWERDIQGVECSCVDSRTKMSSVSVPGK